MGRGARVAGTAPAEYEVVVASGAARAFRKLQGPIRDRVRFAIDALRVDPRPVGCAKLAGRDDYRIRIGEYRVAYAVDDAERLILVARIVHRRDVYRS